MVEDVYTNIQSKINGILSDPFTMMRVVCQGCLFSILLYIIPAEVLASFNNVNKKIKGIQIGDLNYLIRIQLILKLYQDASNSNINFSKSQAIWTGAYEMV